MTQDAVSVAPDHYKVLFENDRVRVLDGTYGPGQKSNLHSHPDLVAFALTVCKVQFGMGDGQTVGMGLKQGEAVFVEGQEHTVENTGTGELRTILVELK